MSLHVRMFTVALVLVGFCGCATHDRLAYQHGYWRGRDLSSEPGKPKVDSETQRKLDEAAAKAGGGAPTGPTVPNPGLPIDNSIAPLPGTAPIPADEAFPLNP